jgi:hypothetical protein
LEAPISTKFTWILKEKIVHTNNEVDEATVKTRHPGEHPETGPEVTITVNGEPKQIHRGSYTGAKLKETLGICASDELDQVVDGQFKPVADDDHVVIKGHEVFVSHKRSGGSS